MNSSNRCSRMYRLLSCKKLLERGDDVAGLDNINDYYDVSLKYGRLKELGIVREDIAEKQFSDSTIFPKHKFIKLDLSYKEGMNSIFETEKFDAVRNLAAQAGVLYSLENPHAYIDSNVVGFMNILEGCRHHNVKNLSYASSFSVHGLNKSQPFKISYKTEYQVSVYGPWGRPDMVPILFTDAILNDRLIKVFNFGK